MLEMWPSIFEWPSFVATAPLHRIITVVFPATSTAVQRQAFGSTWSNDDVDSEEEDYYDLEDGWEDERGEEEYPNEVSEPGDEPLQSPLILHGKTAMSTTLKTRSISDYPRHLIMRQPTTQWKVMKKTLMRRLPSRVRCARKSTRPSARLRMDMSIVYDAFSRR
ncbi:hypothetical protein ARMGADRAFT_1039989 [Armillaria gallica]|uniref:Uncharacterized protein n=1 Tax=Armillaria gallica TaxID=47427 RepID=A0A2H3CWW0_ARMGA|nr:hypothetical protein ARMGADRAFT_1039989 [Armillaria gallica]